MCCWGQWGFMKKGWDDMKAKLLKAWGIRV